MTQNRPYYAPEQEEDFYRAASEHVLLDRTDCELILKGLLEAGITVTIPERRYRAMKSAGSPWLVVDTHATDNAYDDPDTVATFYAAHGTHAGHPDPEAAAHAEARRLNGLVEEIDRLREVEP